MSQGVVTVGAIGGGALRLLGGWTLPVVGLLALFVPAYLEAAGSLWQTDEHAHAPLVLAVSAWLAWRSRRALAAAAPRPDPVGGWTVLVTGLLVYLAGRALDSSVLVFGAQPLLVAATVLLLEGRAALRRVAFPTAYLVFMVPLPAVVVEALTGTLKQWISEIAEVVLHAAGYPIGRSGVVISIGQYQMLVADACSGLNSMLSLAALGTLFMYAMHRPSRLHNALMLASILPIAFIANIVRVILLVLITYHFGDEAGQGFLHGSAAIVLLLTALAVLFALDGALLALTRRRAAPAAGRGA